MTLLQVSDIHTYYGTIEALKGVSLTVEAGEVVTLIGSNGAGKSTTLRAVAGLTPASGGRITFDGEDITGMAADEIVTRGIALSPEGRFQLVNVSHWDSAESTAAAHADPQWQASRAGLAQLAPRAVANQQLYRVVAGYAIPPGAGEPLPVGQGPAG